MPVSAKTHLRMEYLFDLDENELARQQYEIRQDLHCWVGVLRVKEESSEISVMLLFYLKAVPRLRLHSSF